MNKKRKRSRITVSTKAGLFTACFYEYEEKVTICRLARIDPNVPKYIESEGKAYCCPTDTFNPTVGRQLALHRALLVILKEEAKELREATRKYQKITISHGKVIEELSKYENNKCITSISKRK